MKEKLQKILNFQNYLETRIIGQNHVIKAYCEKVSYAEMGISNPHRPKACFFLLGPTGVGKTEIVRETVKYFYDDIDKNLLRIDMSELGETAGEDVGTKLVGRNTNEPGRLYKYLENTQETGGAILYDEFEKAHPDIAKYMLQQLDAGRVTLFNNKVYNLSQYYLFFTSNIGAEIFQGNKHISLERKAEAATKQLVRQFKMPEFIARFGAFDYGILAFNSLKAEDLCIITQKFISDNLQRFRNIKDISPLHPDNLIIRGFSKLFVTTALRKTNTTENGAREIRDIVERMLNQAYVNTFTLDKLGHDITGYLTVDKSKRPIVVDERPVECIDILDQ